MARSGCEVWKDVPGFEGFLVASSYGRVAKIQTFDTGSGYLGLSVAHSKGHNKHLIGQRVRRGEYTLYVHRVIAVTFLGDPPEGRGDAHHKDGNKLNNNHTNLEWLSRSDNVAHAARTGLHRYNRRFSIEQADKARMLYAHGHTMAVVVRETKMSEGAAINAIYQRRRNRG